MIKSINLGKYGSKLRKGIFKEEIRRAIKEDINIKKALKEKNFNRIEREEIVGLSEDIASVANDPTYKITEDKIKEVKIFKQKSDKYGEFIVLGLLIKVKDKEFLSYSESYHVNDLIDDLEDYGDGRLYYLKETTEKETQRMFDIGEKLIRTVPVGSKELMKLMVYIQQLSVKVIEGFKKYIN